MNFKPSKGRILVKPEQFDKVTPFGIILPDNDDLPVTGIVVVGNKEYKEGDKILFSRFGLDEVKIEFKNYCVVSDSGVLGVYE